LIVKQLTSRTLSGPWIPVYVVLIRGRIQNQVVFPGGLLIGKLWVLKLKGKRGSIPELVVRTVHAVTMCGKSSYRNFTFENLDDDTNDEVTLKHVYDEFELLSYNEMDDEVTYAKTLSKKKRTDRQQIIATVGDRMLSRRRDSSQNTLQMMCAEVHYEMKDFLNIDTLECKGFDPVTCIDVTYSLKVFLTGGYFTDTTLVLLGDSTLGKTSLA